ncbi:MAG: molybdopterin-dependent oxidoreductase [Ardenticatenaceae bacterium]
MHTHDKLDRLRPHRHDPNLEPPATAPDLILSRPDGSQTIIDVPYLQSLPLTTLPNCYIVSTGHGTSGPFAFTGARLIDLITAQLPQETPWSQVEVISVDDFGNRVTAQELKQPDDHQPPILLAYAMNGTLMSRKQGLVRMIVPSEKDDALRQVKWIGRINVL